MSILDHPNVMTCYGANEHVEDPFIAMPFKGSPLSYLPLLASLASVKTNFFPSAFPPAEGNLRDFWTKFKLSLSEKLNVAIQISKVTQFFTVSSLPPFPLLFLPLLPSSPFFFLSPSSSSSLFPFLPFLLFPFPTFSRFP